VDRAERSESTTEVTVIGVKDKEFASGSSFGSEATCPSPTQGGQRPSIVQISENSPIDSGVSPGLHETDYTSVPLGTNSSLLMFEHRRAKVLKQMRGLFIFPVLYIVMWQIPFAQHIISLATTQYTYAIWVLYNFSVILLALQGTVNVIVFAIEEKPWRQMKKRKPSTTKNKFLAKLSSFFGRWRRSDKYDRRGTEDLNVGRKMEINEHSWYDNTPHSLRESSEGSVRSQHDSLC